MSRSRNNLLDLSFCACLLAICACVAPGMHAKTENQKISVEVTRSFYLMGTSLEVSVSGPSRDQAIEAAEAAFRAARQTEIRLSTWRPDSELSLLNQAPVGKPVSLSPALERDLRTAYKIAEQSDFTFCPWTGPLVKAWGLRNGGRTPSLAQLRAAKIASRPDAFEWNEHGIIKRRAGALFEEGGFGKGVGLDDALAAIAREFPAHSAVLNFGGQVSILGSKTRVPMEIAVPTDRTQTLLRFEVGAGSVATSGNSEHPGHLLNPRTGKPVINSGSVTVIADTGAEADALTKVVYVLGPEKGLRWANLHGKKALWIMPSTSKAGPRWIARASCAWGQLPEPISPNSRDTAVRLDCDKNLLKEIHHAAL